MTLLFSEGYDVFGTADGLNFGKWYELVTTNNGNSFWNFSYSLIAGRLAGSGFQFNAALTGGSGTAWQYMTFDLQQLVNPYFMSFGFRRSAGSSLGNFMAVYDQAFQLQGYFSMDGSGDPEWVQGGNNTILIPTTTPMTTNQWHYFELATNISTTAGWAEAWMDGTSMGTNYGTGGSRGTANLNNRGTASTQNGIRFVRMGFALGIGNASLNYAYDDVICCDSTGTSLNDHPGNLQVAGLLPNGNGFNSQFVRTGGTASGNFTAVSENPIDSDTSYVAQNTPIGAEDTYRYPVLPVTSTTILAVVAQPVARIDDAGIRTINARVRSGGVEATAPTPNMFLTSNYKIYRNIMMVNPVTGLAWTVADVNNMEVGPVITS